MKAIAETTRNTFSDMYSASIIVLSILLRKLYDMSFSNVYRLTV